MKIKSILHGLFITLSINAKAQNTHKSLILKVGDNVPDITIERIINYPNKSAKIKDFRGKILILDFWATWCSPCVAMIPKMDSLQEQFKDKVQFLPVTYQNETEIKSFFLRYGKNGQKSHYNPEVVSDVKLKKYFPHTALPHYVWIDSNGKVIGITGYEDVTAKNLQKAIANQETNMTVKRDIKMPYDKDKPLFIANNGGDGGNIFYHSLLTGYAPGVQGGTYTPFPDNNKNERIRAVNAEVISLYQLAFRGLGRFNRNRTQIDSKDSLILSFHFREPEMEWFKKNSYCYDLLLPAEMAKDKYAYFRSDLARIFPKYEAKVENQTRKFLALQRITDVNKLHSSGGPQLWKQDQFGLIMHYQNFKMFYWTLDDYYFQNSPMPLIDETGIKGAIDIELVADMSNIESLNIALKKYDLRIVEKIGNIDILVIKDRMLDNSGDAIKN